MKMWIWMPDEDAERWQKMWPWTLKRRISNGSECRTQVWFWMSEEAKHGSEHRDERCNGSERRMKMWLWMSKLKSDDEDYECQTENTMMTLNTETKKWWWWLWTSNGKCDSKRQTEYRWWLWKPKLRMWFRTSNWEVVALSAETEKRWWLWTPTLRMRWGWLWTPILRSDDDDSERQAENVMMMALNAETKNAMMMTLNAETENATLNVKLKMWWWWLWTPQLRSDNSGSECRNWKRGSERQGKKVALYAKQKMNDDSERQNEHVALNAKLRRNGGSERQAKNGWLCTSYLRMDGDSECQTTRKRW